MMETKFTKAMDYINNITDQSKDEHHYELLRKLKYKYIQDYGTCKL